MLAGSPVLVGAQDAHWEAAGPFTGSVSPAQVWDAGARLVILGHSERRHGLGETDDVVRRKVTAALARGLIPLVCVGETDAEREAGQTLGVVTRRSRRRSGSAAPRKPGAAGSRTSPWGHRDGTDSHPRAGGRGPCAASRGAGTSGGPGGRRRLPDPLRGSVKPDVTPALMSEPDIDGALVGGASLKAGDFVSIVRAGLEAKGRAGAPALSHRRDSIVSPGRCGRSGRGCACAATRGRSLRCTSRWSSMLWCASPSSGSCCSRPARRRHRLGVRRGRGQAVFGSMGTPTILGKITTAVAILFMITSFSLAKMSSQVKSVVPATGPAPAAPAARRRPARRRHPRPRRSRGRRSGRMRGTKLLLLAAPTLVGLFLLQSYFWVPTFENQAGATPGGSPASSVPPSPTRSFSTRRSRRIRPRAR